MSKIMPLIFIFSMVLSCSSSASLATDSFLFKKGSFLIHYVSNGGNCNGCEWIAIEGKIPRDAGRLFRKYIVKHDMTDTHFMVTLNSPGGSLHGGLDLGRAIRKYGFDTSIAKTLPAGHVHHMTDGVCYSACAYTFLGGVERSVNGGKFGVHQFYRRVYRTNPMGKIFSATDLSIEQRISGDLLRYIMQMGVSAGLLVEASKTPPNKKMNILSTAQIKDLSIEYDPVRYNEWKLTPKQNKLVATSLSNDKMTKLTVVCKSHNNGELLLTFNISNDLRNSFKEQFAMIGQFSLLDHAIKQKKITLEDRPNKIVMHVPLTAKMLLALEKNKDPIGAFSVHLDESRLNYGFIDEQISLKGLTDSIKFIRSNCKS